MPRAALRPLVEERERLEALVQVTVAAAQPDRSTRQAKPEAASARVCIEAPARKLR
jgi:hypothetical protein